MCMSSHYRLSLSSRKWRRCHPQRQPHQVVRSMWHYYGTSFAEDQWLWFVSIRHLLEDHHSSWTTCRVWMYVGWLIRAHHPAWLCVHHQCLYGCVVDQLQTFHAIPIHTLESLFLRSPLLVKPKVERIPHERTRHERLHVAWRLLMSSVDWVAPPAPRSSIGRVGADDCLAKSTTARKNHEEGSTVAIKMVAAAIGMGRAENCSTPGDQGRRRLLGEGQSPLMVGDGVPNHQGVLVRIG